MNKHMADVDLRPEDGWFTARCTCRWHQGPFPDIETVMDALMEHAFSEGFLQAERVGRANEARR